MGDAGETRSDVTRQKILDAAAGRFARRSFNEVSLDDIVSDTDLSKGALYFHFQSKHSLALATIEHHAAAVRAGTMELLLRQQPGLETLIEITFMVAALDTGDDYARAATHLVPAMSRLGRVSVGSVDEWIKGSVTVLEQAIADGDVRGDCDPEDLAEILVSHYVGVRSVSDLDDVPAFMTRVKNSWCTTLPGFANHDRTAYLTQFIERRAVAAIRAARLPDDA